MATRAAEDYRRPLRRSRRLSQSQTSALGHLGLTVHSKPAVVHSAASRALPSCPLHKKTQIQAPLPLPQPQAPPALCPISGLSPRPLRVTHHHVHQQQQQQQDLHPQCLSARPPLHSSSSASVASFGPLLVQRPSCLTRSSSAGAGARRSSPRSTRHASVPVAGVPRKCPAVNSTSLPLQSSATSFSSSSSSPLLYSPSSPSLCHAVPPPPPPSSLETQSLQQQQQQQQQRRTPTSLYPLDPLRLRSGLLGKRAPSPQLSAYPTCPSPPKASHHRVNGTLLVAVTNSAAAVTPPLPVPASHPVPVAMPTNQSSPWSQSGGAKQLRDAAAALVSNGLPPPSPPSPPGHLSAHDPTTTTTTSVPCQTQPQKTLLPCSSRCCCCPAAARQHCQAIHKDDDKVKVGDDAKDKDKGDGLLGTEITTPQSPQQSFPTTPATAAVPSGEKRSGDVMTTPSPGRTQEPERTREPSRAVKVSLPCRPGRKLSHEVRLTAAVRKLARTNGAQLSRNANYIANATRKAAAKMVASGVRPANSPRQRREEGEGGESPPPAPSRSPVTPSEMSSASSGHPQPAPSPAPAPSPCPHPQACSLSAGAAHHCAMPGESGLPAPSVYSVTSDLSAIHLTRQAGCQAHAQAQQGVVEVEEGASASPSAEEQPSHMEICNGQETVAMLPDGEEEELPDELENNCSGDDNDGSDCCSMNTDADGDGALDSPEEALSVEEPMSTEVEDDRVQCPALVHSLFPLTAPTIYFSTANEKVELLPLEQRRLLKWRMSTVTPNVVKHCITRSHFKSTKKNHDWLGCWGHHMKSPCFKTIREYQKLNHFPGSFQIGRKDRLWRNLSKMQARFGKREFNFFPRSFVLPQDIKLLRKAWEDGGGRQKWIIKPPASARGIGIQVIHKWSQMPRKRPLLVQKYIHKPYLISGNKFDLRIYVYVTSYDPLRIYIFEDGLVRFASCKYSSSMKSLGNKFMHLTNYSVNKKNSEYQSNSDDKACQGHKWALKALWQFLGSKGVNTNHIWEKIKDIVIKTIIASETYVNSLVKMHVRSAYSCHELFGFDIMLDEKLKPWVLEVNISPSLHSNTALDVAIKGQMVRDVLNLAGFLLPQREDVQAASGSSTSSSTSSLCGGSRERCKPELSTDEKVKRAFYLSQRFADQEFYASVLEVLTPDEVRVLCETEDERCRRGQFQRIFPSPTSARYLRFFEHPRYLNILLHQWEHKYWNNRDKGIDVLRNLCQKGVHLGNLSDTVHHWSSKSYTGHVRSDLNSNPTTKRELTKSCVLVGQSVSSSAGADGDADVDVDAAVSSTAALHLLSASTSSSSSSSMAATLDSTSTTPTPSPSPSPSPSLSPTLSPTPTPTTSLSPTPTPTTSLSPSPSPSPCLPSDGL